MNGREILLRSDVERAALDAYSVVWEPSRKLTRDHQKATRAAVADVLRFIADRIVPLTDAEDDEERLAYVNGLADAAKILTEHADLLSPVSSQDTPPPPRPEPRVWQRGVHTDVDPEVQQVVGGRSEVLYTRVSGKRFMWFGQKSSGIGFEYGVGSLLADEGHVTEVLPSVSTDPDGGDR